MDIKFGYEIQLKSIPFSDTMVYSEGNKIRVTICCKPTDCELTIIQILNT